MLFRRPSFRKAKAVIGGNLSSPGGLLYQVTSVKDSMLFDVPHKKAIMKMMMWWYRLQSDERAAGIGVLYLLRE